MGHRAVGPARELPQLGPPGAAPDLCGREAGMGRLSALEAAGVELHARPENWTALAADVLEGLLATPKTLPPRWLYDARGSELFDQITDLDEYYLTRRESALLARVAAEVVEGFEELVELGSGSSTKTPLLLDAMSDARRYVGVDVSPSAMRAAMTRLAARYPGVETVAEVCDFTRDLSALRRDGGGPPPRGRGGRRGPPPPPAPRGRAAARGGPRRAWSPSSARRWATCSPSRCTPSSSGSSRCSPRATRCSSATTSSRTRPSSSRPTTTHGA